MSTSAHGHKHQSLGPLALGALGVVFGDIGTSPLYAVQECFAHGLTPEPANVMGVVSLIFWGLTIVVSIKYSLLVMRADNHGEGGVFSLLALALRSLRREYEQDRPSGAGKKEHAIVWRIMLIGMCGAALFFGDSMVTPAISVLSAVEGLNVITPELQNFVMPIAIGILVILFILQKFGTQRIGNSFGPIMVGWFVCLGTLGIRSIIEHPDILHALNPAYALGMIAHHGWFSFVILGAALLAFTGGEALYADMGHFGLKSIRLAWYGLVMPALTINYFGQGALILNHPDAVSNPFYLLVPKALVFPMIVLSSVATVIASQAVISGTFSVVRQAIQMDYLPRFSVVHTSALEQGQVYLPKVNLFLCISVIMLVLLFRSSNALAGAYGFAVGGAMLVDTLLTSYVALHVWRWWKPIVAAIFVPIVFFDLTFFTTAAAKIPEGGWLPLSVGIIILTIFVTWKQGREIVHSLREDRHEKLESFINTLTPEWPKRSPGTSVYLAAAINVVPQALSSSMRRNHTLRESVIILKIVQEDAPRVDKQHQATIHSLGHGIWQVTLHYGFMDAPHVKNDLCEHMQHHSGIDLDNLTFFVGHSIFIAGTHPFKPVWRKNLFLWLANNVEEDFDYSRMPSEQLVQIGAQIEV